MQKVKNQKSSGNYKLIILFECSILNFELFTLLLRQVLIEIRSDQ